MTEKEARTILGKDWQTWLGTKAAALDSLHEQGVLSAEELQAIKVLSGRESPSEQPTAATSIPPPSFTMPTPVAPQIVEDGVEPDRPDLPPPDWNEMAAKIRALQEQQGWTLVTPPPLYIPPPDFGILDCPPPPRRRYKTPRRYRQENVWFKGCAWSAVILLLEYIAVRLLFG